MNRILIVDDERSQLELLKMYFDKKGYEVKCAVTAADALVVHKAFGPDVTILDIHLPDRDGFTVLEQLRKQGQPAIMITAYHDMETTVKAMKMGASEFVMKPIDLPELHRAVLRTLKLNRKEDPETIPCNPAFLEKGSVIGKSRAMNEVFKTVGILSDNRVTVLIEGETGTGKGLIARAIHDFGPDRGNPFVSVDCSTIVETLLESELFGHEKGAFTGAISMKKGQFEAAGNGTIFLDEIGELPLEIQAKLMRFLQERVFQRVGGTTVLKSNARVIAATNRNLHEMVLERKFREDLYYRLSVAKIALPPLRDREGDVLLLTRQLLGKISAELGKNLRQIEKKAAARLAEYGWPGNVRQLENVLTRAIILTQGGVLLDDTIQLLLGSAESDAGKKNESLQSLQNLESDHIARVLESTRWKRAEAAAILGISRPTLNLKIKQYGLSQKSEN